MKGKVVRGEKDGGRLEKENLKCVHYVLRVFFNLFVCCFFEGCHFIGKENENYETALHFPFF